MKSNLKKTYGAIKQVTLANENDQQVWFINHGQYQKDGTLTCRLAQEVITHYGNRKGSGALNAAFAKQFGATDDDPYNKKEIRSMLFTVPAVVPTSDGGFRPISNEDIASLIASMPNARLIKVLSGEPIITDAETYAMEQGTTTLDDIAEKQLALDEDGKPAINIKTGKEVYRKILFSEDFNEEDDVDLQEYPPAIPNAQKITMQPAIETAATPAR